MTDQPIKPDAEDYAAIDAEHGVLAADATNEQCGHYYRLAQARKLLRLYDHERLPVELIRGIDRVKKEKED